MEKTDSLLIGELKLWKKLQRGDDSASPALPALPMELWLIVLGLVKATELLPPRAVAEAVP